MKRLRYLRSAAGELPARPSRLRRHYAAVTLLVVLLIVPLTRISDATVHASRTPPVWENALPAVWMVERTADHDTFSNGLRLENQFLVHNSPRLCQPIPRDPKLAPRRRSEPAGIVFHTTESDLAPFEPSRNEALQRLGESLLNFVQRHRAYHFLIDRFGRVFRVVAESDVANHAGNSIWADADFVYLNLNDSFLGVSFEARSAPESRQPLNPAQVHAARVLTEMLRSRYGIAAGNCVTHAQVSINPANLQVGYHVDWAAGFPFRELGLPDAYAQPLPGIALFGFSYDETYFAAAAPSLREALQNAGARVARQAALAGLSVNDYRKRLQNGYRQAIAALRTVEPGS